MKKIDLDKILNQIPDYKEFMTISELDDSSIKLAQEFDNVELIELGRTRKDRPIQSYKEKRKHRRPARRVQAHGFEG